MILGKYNEYFGRNKSVFGRYYIDYCLDEISKSHTITEEELSIIKTAKIKYFLINSLNFLIFIYTSRMIYKKGMLELYRGHMALNFRDGFIPRLLISIGSMFYLYREAQRIYYNEVKYIIKKYKYVTSQQYADAVMSSKIAEMYKDKIREIEFKNT